MTYFTEDPTYIWAIGGLLLLFAVVAFFNTGRGLILLAAFAIAAVTAGLLSAERLIVTETEEVEDFLTASAAAVEANDRPAVEQLLVAGDVNAQRLLRDTQHYKFDVVRILAQEITINRAFTPHAARVRALVLVRLKSHEGLQGRVICDLRLVRTEAGWRVKDFSYERQ